MRKGRRREEAAAEALSEREERLSAGTAVKHSSAA